MHAVKNDIQVYYYVHVMTFIHMAVIFLSLKHFILPDFNYCSGYKPELAKAALRAVIGIKEGSTTNNSTE